MLHIFRTLFPRSTSEWLLLYVSVSCTKKLDSVSSVTNNSGHSFSTYPNFSEKIIFFSPWYAHIHMCSYKGIRNISFRKILLIILILRRSILRSEKPNPVGNYMFTVNNRKTWTRCEICSKLKIKTPERRYWRRSGVFIANFEHISHLVLLFLLLTLSR